MIMRRPIKTMKFVKRARKGTFYLENINFGGKDEIWRMLFLARLVLYLRENLLSSQYKDECTNMLQMNNLPYNLQLYSFITDPLHYQPRKKTDVNLRESP